MVTRKTGRHIETEPDYEGAFTLQIRMMPVYTLVYEWCFSDVSVLYANKILLAKYTTDTLVVIPT